MLIRVVRAVMKLMGFSCSGSCTEHTGAVNAGGQTVPPAETRHFLHCCLHNSFCLALWYQVISEPPGDQR